MPFKLHSKGRRHIPRQRHRVANWREYDGSLRNRGSLTIWFTPEAIAGWKAQPGSVTLLNIARNKSPGTSGSRGSDDFTPRLHGRFPEGSVRSC